MAAKRRRDAGEFSGGFFADIYLRREHFRAFLNDTVIRALLLKSRPGNTSWNGVRYLGRGAMGKVGLFARFDGNDNLLEVRGNDRARRGMAKLTFVANCGEGGRMRIRYVVDAAPLGTWARGLSQWHSRLFSGH